MNANEAPSPMVPSPKGGVSRSGDKVHSSPWQRKSLFGKRTRFEIVQDPKTLTLKVLKVSQGLLDWLQSREMVVESRVLDTKIQPADFESKKSEFIELLAQHEKLESAITTLEKKLKALPSPPAPGSTPSAASPTTISSGVTTNALPSRTPTPASLREPSSFIPTQADIAQLEAEKRKAEEQKEAARQIELQREIVRAKKEELELAIAKEKAAKKEISERLQILKGEMDEVLQEIETLSREFTQLSPEIGKDSVFGILLERVSKATEMAFSRLAEEAQSLTVTRDQFEKIVKRELEGIGSLQSVRQTIIAGNFEYRQALGMISRLKPFSETIRYAWSDALEKWKSDVAGVVSLDVAQSKIEELKSMMKEVAAVCRKEVSDAAKETSDKFIRELAELELPGTVQGEEYKKGISSLQLQLVSLREAAYGDIQLQVDKLDDDIEAIAAVKDIRIEKEKQIDQALLSVLEQPLSQTAFQKFRASLLPWTGWFQSHGSLPRYVDAITNFNEVITGYLKICEQMGAGEGGEIYRDVKKLLSQCRQSNKEVFREAIERTYSKAFEEVPGYMGISEHAKEIMQELCQRVATHLTIDDESGVIAPQWNAEKQTVEKGLETLKALHQLAIVRDHYRVFLEDAREKVEKMSGEEKQAGLQMLDNVSALLKKMNETKNFQIEEEEKPLTSSSVAYVEASIKRAIAQIKKLLTTSGERASIRDELVVICQKYERLVQEAESSIDLLTSEKEKERAQEAIRQFREAMVHVDELDEFDTFGLEPNFARITASEYVENLLLEVTHPLKKVIAEGERTRSEDKAARDELENLYREHLSIFEKAALLIGAMGEPYQQFYREVQGLLAEIAGICGAKGGSLLKRSDVLQIKSRIDRVSRPLAGLIEEQNFRENALKDAKTKVGDLVQKYQRLFSDAEEQISNLHPKEQAKCQREMDVFKAKLVEARQLISEDPIEAKQIPSIDVGLEVCQRSLERKILEQKEMTEARKKRRDVLNARRQEFVDDVERLMRAHRTVDAMNAAAESEWTKAFEGSQQTLRQIDEIDEFAAFPLQVPVSRRSTIKTALIGTAALTACALGVYYYFTSSSGGSQRITSSEDLSSETTPELLAIFAKNVVKDTATFVVGSGWKMYENLTSSVSGYVATATGMGNLASLVATHGAALGGTVLVGIGGYKLLPEKSKPPVVEEVLESASTDQLIRDTLHPFSELTETEKAYKNNRELLIQAFRKYTDDRQGVVRNIKDNMKLGTPEANTCQIALAEFDDLLRAVKEELDQNLPIKMVLVQEHQHKLKVGMAKLNETVNKQLEVAIERARIRHAMDHIANGYKKTVKDLTDKAVNSGGKEKEVCEQALRKYQEALSSVQQLDEFDTTPIFSSRKKMVKTASVCILTVAAVGGVAYLYSGYGPQLDMTAIRGRVADLDSSMASLGAAATGAIGVAYNAATGYAAHAWSNLSGACSEIWSSPDRVGKVVEVMTSPAAKVIGATIGAVGAAKFVGVPLVSRWIGAERTSARDKVEYLLAEAAAPLNELLRIESEKEKLRIAITAEIDTFCRNEINPKKREVKDLEEGDLELKLPGVKRQLDAIEANARELTTTAHFLLPDGKHYHSVPYKDLSLKELRNYLGIVKGTIAGIRVKLGKVTTGTVVTAALKKFQGEVTKAEERISQLTSGERAPSRANESKLQFATAAFIRHGDRRRKIRGLDAIKKSIFPAPAQANPNEILARLKACAHEVSALVAQSRKFKILSLLVQIKELAGNPPEQRRAKKAFLDILHQEALTHEDSVRLELGRLVTLPIRDLVSERFSRTKSFMLDDTTLKPLLKAHRTGWDKSFDHTVTESDRSDEELDDISEKDLLAYQEGILRAINDGKETLVQIRHEQQRAVNARKQWDDKLRAVNAAKGQFDSSDQLLAKLLLERAVKSAEEKMKQFAYQPPQVGAAAAPRPRSWIQKVERRAFWIGAVGLVMGLTYEAYSASQAQQQALAGRVSTSRTTQADSVEGVVLPYLFDAAASYGGKMWSDLAASSQALWSNQGAWDLLTRFASAVTTSLPDAARLVSGHAFVSGAVVLPVMRAGGRAIVAAGRGVKHLIRPPAPVKESDAMPVGQVQRALLEYSQFVGTHVGTLEAGMREANQHQMSVTDQLQELSRMQGEDVEAARAELKQRSTDKTALGLTRCNASLQDFQQSLTEVGSLYMKANSPLYRRIEASIDRLMRENQELESLFTVSLTGGFFDSRVSWSDWWRGKQEKPVVDLSPREMERYQEVVTAREKKVKDTKLEFPIEALADHHHRYEEVIGEAQRLVEKLKAGLPVEREPRWMSMTVPSRGDGQLLAAFDLEEALERIEIAKQEAIHGREIQNVAQLKELNKELEDFVRQVEDAIAKYTSEFDLQKPYFDQFLILNNRLIAMRGDDPKRVVVDSLICELKKRMAEKVTRDLASNNSRLGQTERDLESLNELVSLPEEWRISVTREIQKLRDKYTGGRVFGAGGRGQFQDVEAMSHAQLAVRDPVLSVRTVIEEDRTQLEGVSRIRLADGSLAAYQKALKDAEAKMKDFIDDGQYEHAATLRELVEKTKQELKQCGASLVKRYQELMDELGSGWFGLRRDVGDPGDDARKKEFFNRELAVLDAMFGQQAQVLNEALSKTWRNQTSFDQLEKLVGTASTANVADLKRKIVADIMKDIRRRQSALDPYLVMLEGTGEKPGLVEMLGLPSIFDRKIRDLKDIREKFDRYADQVRTQFEGGALGRDLKEQYNELIRQADELTTDLDFLGRLKITYEQLPNDFNVKKASRGISVMNAERIAGIVKSLNKDLKEAMIGARSVDEVPRRWIAFMKSKSNEVAKIASEGAVELTLDIEEILGDTPDDLFRLREALKGVITEIKSKINSYMDYFNIIDSQLGTYFGAKTTTSLLWRHVVSKILIEINRKVGELSRGLWVKVGDRYELLPLDQLDPILLRHYQATVVEFSQKVLTSIDNVLGLDGICKDLESVQKNRLQAERSKYMDRKATEADVMCGAAKLFIASAIEHLETSSSCVLLRENLERAKEVFLRRGEHELSLVVPWLDLYRGAIQETALSEDNVRTRVQIILNGESEAQKQVALIPKCDAVTNRHRAVLAELVELTRLEQKIAAGLSPAEQTTLESFKAKYPNPGGVRQHSERKIAELEGLVREMQQVLASGSLVISGVSTFEKLVTFKSLAYLHASEFEPPMSSEFIQIPSFDLAAMKTEIHGAVQALLGRVGNVRPMIVRLNALIPVGVINDPTLKTPSIFEFLLNKLNEWEAKLRADLLKVNGVDVNVKDLVVMNQQGQAIGRELDELINGIEAGRIAIEEFTPIWNAADAPRRLALSTEIEGAFRVSKLAQPGWISKLFEGINASSKLAAMPVEIQRLMGIVSSLVFPADRSILNGIVDDGVWGMIIRLITRKKDAIVQSLNRIIVDIGGNPDPEKCREIQEEICINQAKVFALQKVFKNIQDLETDWPRLGDPKFAELKKEFNKRFLRVTDDILFSTLESVTTDVQKVVSMPLELRARILAIEQEIAALRFPQARMLAGVVEDDAWALINQGIVDKLGHIRELLRRLSELLNRAVQPGDFDSCQGDISVIAVKVRELKKIYIDVNGLERGWQQLGDNEVQKTEYKRIFVETKASSGVLQALSTVAADIINRFNLEG